MKKITVDQLRDVGACARQVALFSQMFGAEVCVSVELAESVAGRFEWDFAARQLLPPDAWAEYTRAREEALAEYMRVEVDARAEYARAKAKAFAQLYLRESAE